MPFKVIINVGSIRDKINRFSLPKAEAAGLKKARLEVETRKQKFLTEFENHPVSQDIQGGPSQNNGISGQNGNLYSFIGFDSGSDPIGDLHYYFSNAIRLISRKGIYNASSKTLTYRMSIPSEEGIKRVTDLAKYTQNNNENSWGEGRSWAFSIERGIPGLNKYKFSNNEKVLGGESRSGTGLQRHNIIHAGANYKPRKYITELLKILTR